MNGKQIFDIVSRTFPTYCYFYNIYAVDNIRLPSFNSRDQYFIIVNTAPSTHMGLHWIAMFKPKAGKCVFIDSMGRDPMEYDIRIGATLKKMIRETIFYDFEKISYPLQSYNSNLCGAYCIFILYFLCKGLPLSTILSWFHPYEQLLNDSLILKWFKGNFY